MAVLLALPDCSEWHLLILPPSVGMAHVLHQQLVARLLRTPLCNSEPGPRLKEQQFLKRVYVDSEAYIKCCATRAY